MRNLCHLAVFLILSVIAFLRADAAPISNVARPEAHWEDSDDDGLEDALEFQLGTDPFSPDSDDDEWNDLAELISGTDPLDAEDYPRFLEVAGVPQESSRSFHRLRAIELSSSLHPSKHRTAPRPGDAPQSVSYYYLPGRGWELAAEIKRSNLVAGSYLLLWRQRVMINPLGLRQHYIVTISRADGQIIGEWRTPAEVTLRWNHVCIPFTLTTAEHLQALTISIRPEVGAGLQYAVAEFGVVPAGLEADVDRDGVILTEERPTAGQSLRHWVNDDDDEGPWQERGDVPGLMAHAADHGQPGIDGHRDLVDYIPLNLVLGSLVRRLPASDGFRYLLRNDDQAIQCTPTSLTRATVGAIHRNAGLTVFGPTLDGPCETAETLRAGDDGAIELPEYFLEYIAWRNHGVLLLEFTRPTARPLRLEVRKEGRLIVSLELPLEVVPVETMYRHVDLTRSAMTYEGQPVQPKTAPRPTSTASPPGLPDSATNDRWVVMIHGYNVTAQAARGWQAETFKRLRALGSNARFVGVTWNGDTGLDYHRAVFQAFQTGDGLPRALGFVDQSRTTLVAHSLGNIVAGQGVQAGFTPARFFMLNAALPIEAIAGESAAHAHVADMTEASWRAYPRRLFAADWWKLYGESRQRLGYAWPNCFSRVRFLKEVINCYSSGEEITNCPPSMTSASILATLWAGRSVDYGVWKTQELLKGVGWTRSLGALPMERTQGGWGFNAAWRGRFVPSGPERLLGGRFEPLTPEVASRITDAQLRAHPFFRPFELRWLHVPAIAPGSPLIEAPRVRYDLLARGLPALSPAAGGIPLPSLGGASGVSNYDLESQGRPAGGSWPSEGHQSELTKDRWLHSDFKNVALPYAYPLYQTMINRGALR